jgi:hypothetical protein
MILATVLIPSPAFQSAMAVTTNLSTYVGTGMLVPAAPFASGFATPDNSLIRVSQVAGEDFAGTETITYYYGSTLLLAAPPSLVMLSLGLIVIGGLAWRWRKAKRAA